KCDRSPQSPARDRISPSTKRRESRFRCARNLRICAPDRHATRKLRSDGNSCRRKRAPPRVPVALNENADKNWLRCEFDKAEFACATKAIRAPPWAGTRAEAG